MTETGTPTLWKSPLYQMTQTTPTCLWNDSASIEELRYSIEHGAVGATCNPVIVLDVLKKSMDVWRPKIAKLIVETSAATEDVIAWKLVERISIKAAELLKPIFDQQKGRNGRLSIQTDPRFFRSKAALIEQAVHFSELAPNIIVKIPATSVGIAAMEEVTYRGVSVRDGEFHPPAGPCRRRSGGTRPQAARARGQADRHDGAGLHDHGRKAR